MLFIYPIFIVDKTILNNIQKEKVIINIKAFNIIIRLNNYILLF